MMLLGHVETSDVKVVLSLPICTAKLLRKLSQGCFSIPSTYDRLCIYTREFDLQVENSGSCGRLVLLVVFEVPRVLGI